MSESDADSSIFDNDTDEDNEDEEEREYEDGCEYDDEFEDEDEDEDEDFCCDIELMPFVIRLFILLDQDVDTSIFSSEASQKVRRLLKDYPEAAGVYSNLHGLYPLQLACRKQAPLEVIAALVKAFPEALHMSQRLKLPYDDFDYEMYPLQHALCGANASFDVICFLVSQWPGSLQLPTLGGGGSHFALHLACQANVSLRIIQYLLLKWPGALKRKGEHGLPLHYACRGGADLSTITFLIQTSPDSLQVPNESGALPLHEACIFRGEHAEVSAWTTFRRACSLAAASTLPSLLQLSNHADSPPPPPPVMLLQTLVQAWLAAVCVLDKEGFVPLHHLCYGEPALLVDIQLLAEAWPEALQVATGGMLPLHSACRHDFPLEVI